MIGRKAVLLGAGVAVLIAASATVAVLVVPRRVKVVHDPGAVKVIHDPAISDPGHGVALAPATSIPPPAQSNAAPAAAPVRLPSTTGPPHVVGHPSAAPPPPTTIPATEQVTGTSATTAESTANALFADWQANNRSAASAVATPAAVDSLFAGTYNPSDRFAGCQPDDVGDVICAYSFGDGYLRFFVDGNRTGWMVTAVQNQPTD